MTGLDSLAFACVALSASISPQPADAVPTKSKDEFLMGAAHNFQRVMISSRGDDLKSPKISPLNEWKFSRVTNVYCRGFADASYDVRFRVFSPNESWQLKLGHPTGRYLGRLWDLMRNRLSVDHSEKFRSRMIDVFLCEKGQAGGQQILDRDPFELDDFGKEPLAMMIYIYQVGRWNRPIDRCRELAHEYGQAVLPAPGGFPAPEPWTNGILGESLFLSWLREGIGNGTISPQDAFGITVAELDAYLAEKVTPKLRSAALKGPRTDLINSRSAEGFDAFIALNLWAESILPKRAYGRGLRLGIPDDKSPGLLPKGLVEGAEEQGEWEMKAPSWAGQSPIWIPLGKGRLSGGKILKRDASGWAQVQPTAGMLKIVNPPITDPA